LQDCSGDLNDLAADDEAGDVQHTRTSLIAHRTAGTMSREATIAAASASR
jgi:hypothetical protein